MWRVLEKHGVTIWFTAPTAMRMLNRFGIERARRTDLGRLRRLFLAGEILDVPTYHWSTEAVNGIPVLDNYWLTESGWPMVAYPAGIEAFAVKPGSPGRPVPGYDLAVVDGEGKPLPAGTRGLLVARAPLPPGNIMTVWQDDERYLDEYWRQFPGESVFATGDYAVADEEGYLQLLGRYDDVLNVAAHRLSIGEIEGVLGSHPAVADACVVGVADAIKGEEPAALIVLEAGNEPSGQLRVAIKNHIRERIGAVATPRTIRFVPCLPRTSDGRFMRNLFRAICEGRDLSAVTITEEGASAEEVAQAARQMAGAVE
jgi:propionyl-CoA synthetase